MGEKIKSQKDSNENWYYFVGAAIVIAGIVAAGLVATDGSRFWISGLLSALLIRWNQSSKRFMTIYSASMLLMIGSLFQTSFWGFLFVFLAESILLLWHINDQSAKRQNSSEPFLLTPMLANLALLVALYSSTIGEEYFKYFLYAYVILRPLLWIDLDEKYQDTAHKCAYIFSICAVGTVFLHFPLVDYVDGGLILLGGAILLVLFGKSLAVPMITYLSLVLVDPRLGVFSGALVFAAFCSGWTLIAAGIFISFFVGLKATLYTDPSFWIVVSLSSLLFSYVASLKRPSFEDVKQEIIPLLFFATLAGTALYVNIESFLPELRDFQPLCLMPAGIFLAATILFHFFLPKLHVIRIGPEIVWRGLMATARSKLDRYQEGGPGDDGTYNFSTTSRARVFADNETYQVLLWLVFMVIGVWGLYLVYAL